MKFSSTHMSKKGFFYVQEVGRADGSVTYADIHGKTYVAPESAFDADFMDLSKQRRHSEAYFADELADDAPQGPTPFRRYTQAEIDAAASPQGGYGKAELATLGITYPPKRGWQEALKAGLDPNNPPARLKSARGVEGDTELLMRVVVDIIEQGQAHLICHIPGLLDRFGARIPSLGEEGLVNPDDPR
jgi:hypothetical protein